MGIAFPSSMAKVRGGLRLVERPLWERNVAGSNPSPRPPSLTNDSSLSALAASSEGNSSRNFSTPYRRSSARRRHRASLARTHGLNLGSASPRSASACWDGIGDSRLPQAARRTAANVECITRITASTGSTLLAPAERRSLCEVPRDGAIPRPTIVLAVTMFTVGILHGRLAAWGDRLRQLRVEPTASACPAPAVLASADAHLAGGRVDRGGRRAAVVTAIVAAANASILRVLNAKPFREALGAARVQPTTRGMQPAHLLNPH